jgi:hypothetical protein
MFVLWITSLKMPNVKYETLSKTIENKWVWQEKQLENCPKYMF